MKNIIFTIITFLMISIAAQASVWESDNNWSKEYDLKYSKWVKEKIGRKFFSQKNTLLYNFRTDCADALYAFRIQFSFENGLPFAMVHPDDDTRILTNKTGDFDKYKNQTKRIRAFIEYISQEAGTLNLIKDSFPVDINDLREGDIYVTKWSFLGESARHSSIIKEINFKKGHINFLSSNYPRKVRKLIYSPRTPDFTFNRRPWGYRRWKRAYELLIPLNEISVNRGYSEMEYDLLSKYGPSKVHKKIRNILKTKQ